MKKSPLKEEILEIQEKKLIQLLAYLQQNSPFYQEHFRKHHIDPAKIRSVAGLSLVPTTTKTDLQQKNQEFLCVPKHRIAEYCTTSGTLGDFVSIALTANDLDRLARNEAASVETMDCDENDLFQLMLTLDRQFMAGIAYYTGIRKANAGVIRVGPGNFGMQLETILRLEPTVLVAVPSFVLQLTRYALQQGINLDTTTVRKILCIGENIRNSDFSLNALGERITQAWNVKLYSTYASTEKQTAFTECSHGQGGHSNPELLIFEVLDDNDQPVAPGNYGELAVTTLGVEGMPLLRYKTGDICTWFDEPCTCGRHSARISPITGRRQQLIKYQGTTLYPPAIFNVLNKIPEIEDYVVEITRNDFGMDDLCISLALCEHNIAAEQKIRESLQAALRVVPFITYRSITEIQKLQLPEGKRKVSKVIDKR
jgi:phenylacetate-CoA ligase